LLILTPDPLLQGPAVSPGRHSSLIDLGLALIREGLVPMRIRFAALALPALLLGLVPWAVSAAGPGSADAQAVAARHARVLAHWTPARVANARSRDFDLDPVRGFVPEAKPGGGGGGGGTGSVTGASWTGGGAILRSTGRVLFSLPSGDYICSGSVVSEASSTQSIVLTAGHCVVENDGTFASNWVFLPEFDSEPSYNCATRVHGCWVADALYADKTFATSGSFNNAAVTHDFAFAVVSTGGASGTAQLDTSVGGGFGIAYSGVASGDTLSAFGYPAAGKYHGSDLVYCKGSIGTDASTGGATWSMPCDMTGGSSGGPWVSSTDPTKLAGTTLRSLNSYGYSGVKAMFGPKFNADTQAVFNAANSGSLTSTVVRTLLP